MEADHEKNQGVESPNLRFPGLVDSRNRDLWESLQEKYRFELQESPEPGFLTYFDGNTVIIEVDAKEISPAAFTHELLHVFLKSEGLKIVVDLKSRVEEDPELSEIFTTSLRVHIGNCLEHVKMLPLFLALGFARKDFLRDYHKKFVKMAEMKKLSQNYFFNGTVVMESADKYIGCFFAMKASVNPRNDYTPMLQMLQKTDSSLYSLLDNFWKGWLLYELVDPKENYLDLLNAFLLEIKGWKKKAAEEPYFIKNPSKESPWKD